MKQMQCADRRSYNIKRSGSTMQEAWTTIAPWIPGAHLSESWKKWKTKTPLPLLVL